MPTQVLVSSRELRGLALYACLAVSLVRPSIAGSPVRLSENSVRIKVPVEKQETPRQCGLACAQMIGGFYGQKLSAYIVNNLESVSEAGTGIMGSELLIAFRAADYDAAVFPGTLDKEKTGLFYHLDKKRPLIVMITAKDMKNSHYDVVTGYDPINQLLLITDPSTGPMTITTKAFLPAWRRTQFFTLLAIPKKFNTEATPVPDP